MKLKKMVKLYCDEANAKARLLEEAGETDGGLDYLYQWAILDCLGVWVKLRGIALGDAFEQAHQDIQTKMQRYWRRNP